MLNEKGYSSLEERIYLELEEEIISGKLPRGTVLREISLSERLGVSRTPIRSALHRLSEDGLIESSVNRGCVVVGVTEDDLEDIYKIRVRLEGLASSIAAVKISPEDLGALRESVELAEFYIKKNNTEKLKELDSVFHEKIYEATGNRLLAKTLSVLHRRIKAYRRLSLTVPGRLERSVYEHREILHAIERGDSEAADLLTSRHIKEALDNVMRALNENRAKGE